MNREDALPGRAVCLDAHDLVVSKLVAGREKDVEFAIALIKARLIDIETLAKHTDMLETPKVITKRVRTAIERCARLAGQQGKP